MVQLQQVLNRETIMMAGIAAAVWALTHYFIRLGMNPQVTDLESKRQDTMYGALAVFAAQIINAIVRARMA